MPELRKDPVIGRWVIIATERSLRPHDYKIENEEKNKDLSKCPFEEGNESLTPPEILSYRKVGTNKDEPGWWVRVVPNKFPALRIEGELEKKGIGMFDMMNGIGAHEVVIETPNHFEEMADMPETQIQEVIWAWRDRVLDLKKDKRFKYILIFKNKGSQAGASLEHPHSQIIALPIVPIRVQQELNGSKEYFNFKDRCVFVILFNRSWKIERDWLKKTMNLSLLSLLQQDFLLNCGFCQKNTLQISLMYQKVML